MSRIVDNIIAFKIIAMLVKPFTETEAFKLGIIDAHGNNLRKTNQFSTDAERNAYSYLNRLVFNMKRLIAKLPGGDNRIKSMAAALWLVKEHYESGNRTTSQMESKFKKIMESNVHLVEEEILVGKFLKEDGDGAIGGAPTNNTSGPVATQEPKIYPKSKKKPIMGIARRPQLNVKEIK
jgi:hypothetical protein